MVVTIFYYGSEFTLAEIGLEVILSLDKKKHTTIIFFERASRQPLYEIKMCGKERWGVKDK